MTSEELANSKQPLAPEYPLEAPQQNVVAEEFDAAKPAPTGASQPAVNDKNEPIIAGEPESKAAASGAGPTSTGRNPTGDNAGATTTAK